MEGSAISPSNVERDADYEVTFSVKMRTFGKGKDIRALEERVERILQTSLQSKEIRVMMFDIKELR